MSVSTRGGFWAGVWTPVRSPRLVRVNVAEWDSEDAWREAQASPEFFRAALQRLVADPELHVSARPAIHDVVVEVPADPT